MTVMYRQNQPPLLIPAVPSFSAFATPPSHSLLHFPRLVYSSFTEDYFYPFARRPYSNPELQLGVSRATPSASRSARTMQSPSEGIVRPSRENYDITQFFCQVKWTFV